jgi:hypothetical protein
MSAASFNGPDPLSSCGSAIKIRRKNKSSKGDTAAAFASPPGDPMEKTQRGSSPQPVLSGVQLAESYPAPPEAAAAADAGTAAEAEKPAAAEEEKAEACPALSCCVM